MATTTAAIRDVMRRTVRSLVPSVLANVRYTLHDERGDFETWAEANPTAAFRRVAIRSTGSIEPPVVSNTDQEWISTGIDVVIAYPRDHRYGAQLRLDLDDVIEADLRQIEHAIGTNGYAALDLTTGGDALVMTEATERLPGAANVYGLLRLSAGFWRVMP